MKGSHTHQVHGGLHSPFGNTWWALFHRTLDERMDGGIKYTFSNQTGYTQIHQSKFVRNINDVKPAP